MEVPVYLFTGFLESGKTKFIQETLEDERFNAGERTLLILCEEGIEEYDPSLFSGKNVYIKTVDEKDDLKKETLAAWYKEAKAQRVIIEYNGMWTLDVLYNEMPDKWTVYQEMMFADSNTFESYNANMRSLVVDKLKSAELVIFNRFTDTMDKMPLHKIVRGISRNNAIVYEYTDGSTEEDTIEDPLPFDINANLIEIADPDYALWYRDMMEETQKYHGKSVKFKALVANDKRFPDNCFIAGRHVMTCCADDIQYAGLIAEYKDKCTLKTGDWVIITADIAIEKHKAYRGIGPVLKVKNYALTSEPEEKVVTF
jgi:uncharacterized membrane protein YcgQ (UPF0703/DUF1980 family)